MLFLLLTMYLSRALPAKTILTCSNSVKVAAVVCIADSWHLYDASEFALKALLCVCRSTHAGKMDFGQTTQPEVALSLMHLLS